jgi:hypothetical protein
MSHPTTEPAPSRVEILVHAYADSIDRELRGPSTTTSAVRQGNHE